MAEADQTDGADAVSFADLEGAGALAARAGIDQLDAAVRAAAATITPKSGSSREPLSPGNARALEREVGRVFDGVVEASASAVDVSITRAVRATADAIEVDPAATPTLVGAVARSLDLRRGDSLGELLAGHEADALRDATRLIRAGEALGLSEARIRRDLAGLLRGDYLPLVDYGFTDPDMSGLRTLYGDIKRIVVSEANNAMREAGVRALSTQRYRQAQWTLSARHRVPDECDDLASHSGGWYPLDAWPDAPHPYCGCYPGRAR